MRAVSTAEQVAQEVLRVDAHADASDHHLRVIGVTWNDEAAAQAALLLEALTDAGFDNVVPVRLLEAVETLARAIAPVIGYEQTAVCVLEHEWATVVMVDTHDGETQTVVKHVSGGFDGLRSWLTGMFDRTGWRPGAVVVVGADSDINGFSWQLEKALPVPVFAQTMAQVTVARGAALAAARSTEFTDEELIAHTSEPTRRRTATARAAVLRGGRDRAGRRCDHLRLVARDGRRYPARSRRGARIEQARGARTDTRSRRGRRTRCGTGAHGRGSRAAVGPRR